jgi:hypothetical protein
VGPRASLDADSLFKIIHFISNKFSATVMYLMKQVLVPPPSPSHFILEAPSRNSSILCTFHTFLTFTETSEIHISKQGTYETQCQPDLLYLIIIFLCFSQKRRFKSRLSSGP